MPAEMTFKRALSDAQVRRWLWPGLVLAVSALVLAILSYRMMRNEWWAALADGKVGPNDFARWGTYWATSINAVLLGAGALFVAIRLNVLVRRLMRGMRNVECESGNFEIVRNSIQRREWLWLLLVLVLAGGLRWPRMDLSFYNDEMRTFRNNIAGQFRPGDDGQLKWRQAKWGNTLWLNKFGNNLVPCSLFGRLSYDAWRKISGSPEGTVSETVVRLPQFVAGLASLAVLWLAMRRMCGARAAWCVLVLAALHPWHVRYSTEARAYGILLLAVAWNFYSLQRALEDNRWRWWLSLGFAQFICLWSFTGIVYFLFVFDGAVLIVLSHQAMKRRGVWISIARFGIGLLFGAMLTLHLMLPTVPQLMEAMRVLDSVKGVMGREWWADALSGVFFGMRGWDLDPTNPDNLALLRETAQRPWLWVVVAVAVLLWGVGTVRLLRRNAAGGISVLSGPVAVLLSWAVMSAQGKYMHSWYLLFAVPGVVLSVVAGLECLVECQRGGQTGRVAAGLCGLMISISWLATDLHYTRHTKENLRGLAEAGRGLAQPHGIYAGMIADVVNYDPRVVLLKTAAALDDEIARARRDGLPLAVSVGHVGIEETSQVFERLKGSGEFEEAGVFRGMDEAQFTHYLFRLRDAR